MSGRRAERLLALSISALSVAALALLQQPVFYIAGAMIAAALLLWWSFSILGWVGGPRRIVRIAFQPDGHWLLCDAHGRIMDDTLSGASRVTSHAVWLRWNGRCHRPLLLLSGDIPAGEFRRLVVRLRLGDRLIPGRADDEP